MLQPKFTFLTHHYSASGNGLVLLLLLLSEFVPCSFFMCFISLMTTSRVNMDLFMCGVLQFETDVRVRGDRLVYINVVDSAGQRLVFYFLSTRSRRHVSRSTVLATLAFNDGVGWGGGGGGRRGGGDNTCSTWCYTRTAHWLYYYSVVFINVNYNSSSVGSYLIRFVL